MCDNNIFCDFPIYDSKSTSLSLIVDLSKLQYIYIYICKNTFETFSLKILWSVLCVCMYLYCTLLLYQEKLSKFLRVKTFYYSSLFILIFHHSLLWINNVPIFKWCVSKWSKHAWYLSFLLLPHNSQFLSLPFLSPIAT